MPVNALYGAQTQRAVENFPISGLTAHPELIRATILIKKAAAQANAESAPQAEAPAAEAAPSEAAAAKRPRAPRKKKPEGGEPASE